MPVVLRTLDRLDPLHSTRSGDQFLPLAADSDILTLLIAIQSGIAVCSNHEHRKSTRPRTMSTQKEPLIGFCPIGNFVFSHEDAMRLKGLVRAKLDQWKVRYVDLESVLPDGMVRDQKHAEPAVRFFQQQGIDALFIPHCNFGTEGAAGNDRQAVRRAHAAVGAAR